MVFPLVSRLIGRHSRRQSPEPRHPAVLRLLALEDRTVPSGMVGDLVVFGDSLSDVGNVSLPSALYFQGRSSNGPIWVDTLAEYLDEPALRPSLAGGLDYAFAGALLESNPPSSIGVPSLAAQVGAYLGGHTPKANDVFTLFGGANDFFVTSVQPDGPVSPDQPAAALTASLQTLYAAGGRTFVVANLPSLGQTPLYQDLLKAGFLSQTQIDAINAWSAGYDAYLAFDLAQFGAQHADAHVIPVDVAGLFQQILASPASFGFTNVSNAVGPYTGSTLTSIDAGDHSGYLFYDGVHPGSKAHQLLGLTAAARVGEALGFNAITVDNTSDAVDPLDGGLSLREALNLANAQHGRQTVNFRLGRGPQTIKLGAEIAVTDSVVIDGSGECRLTVSGHNASRVFSVTGATTAVTLSDLTIADGLANDATAISPLGFPVTAGGGLFVNAARVTLSHVTFRNNVSDGLAAGGGGAVGLLFGATLTASHVTWTDNLARGPFVSGGGAIYADAGSTVTIDHADFEDNTTMALFGGDPNDPIAIQGAGLGGALTVAGGSHGVVTHSTFQENLAQGGSGLDSGFGSVGGVGDGGAIFLSSDGMFVPSTPSTLVIDHDTFEDNLARGGTGTPGSEGGEGLGGAIRVAGSRLTVTDSTFEDNQAVGGNGGTGGVGGGGGGGAIHVITNDFTRQLHSTVDVIHSTFKHNTARGGTGGAAGTNGNGGQGGEGSGGAILTRSAALNVVGGKFDNNGAIGGAGGDGGTVGQDGAGGDAYGGVISASGRDGPGSVVITDSSLKGNEARGGNGFGGGVYNAANSTLTLIHTDVKRNQAIGARGGQGVGGGVYNLGTVLIGPGVKIKDNDASTSADDEFGL